MCRPPQLIASSIDFEIRSGEFEWAILTIAVAIITISFFLNIEIYDSLNSSIFRGDRELQYNNSSSNEKFLTAEHLEPIALRQWKKVLSWIAFNTDEVGSLRDRKGQTVLHHASLFRAPVDIIESILWAAPELASVANQDGEVALHWAIRLSTSSHILNLLLQADPESAFVSDYQNSTPLSLLWERRQSALFGIWRYDRQRFLKECNLWKRILSIFQAVDKVQNPMHPELFFPLHVAARRCTPPGLFSFMIEIYKDQLSIKDTDGQTPLTLSCQSASSNRSPDILTKIQLILREDPTQAKHKDKFSNGRYPLHHALDSGISWNEGIEALIETFPSSLSERDPVSGLFPFALAAIHNKSDIYQFNERDSVDFQLTTVYSLLREDPSVIKINT